MIRRAARTDSNQREIVTALRAAGIGVTDTSGLGDGFPDLVCMHRGVTRLVEIKDGSKPPSARKLTPDQVKFHAFAATHAVHIPVVENVAQALAVFGVHITIARREARAA